MEVPVFFSRFFTDKRTPFVISYGSEQVQMNRIRMFLQQSHQPLPTCGQHHGTDLLGGEWKPGPQDAGAQRVWQDDPGDWGWNEQWQTDCKGSSTDLTESWWGKPPTRQGVVLVHYFCIFLFDNLISLMPAPFNTAFSVQAAYMKILESSQTLLHVLKRETASWQHWLQKWWWMWWRWLRFQSSNEGQVLVHIWCMFVNR